MDIFYPNKTPAIKAVWEMTGLGLKVAKEIVELAAPLILDENHRLSEVDDAISDYLQQTGTVLSFPQALAVDITDKISGLVRSGSPKTEVQETEEFPEEREETEAEKVMRYLELDIIYLQAHIPQLQSKLDVKISDLEVLRQYFPWK